MSNIYGVIQNDIYHNNLISNLKLICQKVFPRVKLIKADFVPLLILIKFYILRG